jgi:hypothetical protein
MVAMSPLVQKLLVGGLGTVIGAVVALFGVAVSQFFTGRRESLARYDAHVTRLLAKRYELYLRYIDVLDRNADHLIGEHLLKEKPVTVLETHQIEREMKLFASAEVVVVADSYRDLVRRAAADASTMTEADRRELSLELSFGSNAMLAAMRADLAIDRLAYGKARHRYRLFDRLLRAETASHIELRNRINDVRQSDAKTAMDSDGGGGDVAKVEP